MKKAQTNNLSDSAAADFVIIDTCYGNKKFRSRYYCQQKRNLSLLSSPFVSNFSLSFLIPGPPS